MEVATTHLPADWDGRSKNGSQSLDWHRNICNKMHVCRNTRDNKSLFVCDYMGGFREFEIATYKQPNNFKVQSTTIILVTYDNKYLIITESDSEDTNFLKYSIKTKKLVNTWHINTGKNVSS